MTPHPVRAKPEEVDSLLSVRVAAKEAGARPALNFSTLGTPLGRTTSEITYEELSAASEQAATHLSPDGNPVALVTSVNLGHLAVLCACLAKQVPVLLLSPSAPFAVRKLQIDSARATSVFDENRWHPLTCHNNSITYAADSQFLVPTSGTTADAKIAVLTRSGVVASALASQLNLPLLPDSRWALTLPYCHVGGLSILLRALIARCAAVAGPWDFTSEDGCRRLETESVTHVSLVPTQLARLLQCNIPPPPRLKVALIGGAACLPQLRKDARAAGWPAVFSYGFTEASSQVCTQTLDRSVSEQPERDVGRPLPGMEVALDEKGCIAVRGPTLMSGYLGQAPLEEGAWFLTQDLGFWDSEDRLVLVGRADSTIVSGGENVSAERVEECLCTSPFIDEAAVFGVSDEIWGERVVALVTGREVSLEEISSALKGDLEPFALPKEIYFCAALPRLGSGKLDRRGARDLLETMREPTRPKPD